MAWPRHSVLQHRSALPGIEPMTLRTDHHFPRHAHDGFGIGLMTEGAQRSWSGIGQVESGAGDIITVNPGEMHDGAPIGDGPRGWRILYLDPGLVAREVAEEGLDRPEIARPALHDPPLARRLGRLFARLTAPAPDGLGVEEELVATLVTLLRHHGAGRVPASGPSPAVAAARRRLDAAPEQRVTLAELAALSGVSRFQLLRGFAREVGATPHAYLLQRRVRLARRFLSSSTRRICARCPSARRPSTTSSSASCWSTWPIPSRCWLRCAAC
jgi:AraC-like DNA-binding protein